MAESIFEPVGQDRYLPTEASLSPWSDQAMHGGPPTMLMAREIERFSSDQEMMVTRLTVELMRPVGRTPLEAKVRLVRPGRKVQIVEASLWNAEQEVARATALRIRTADVDVPLTDDPLPHPSPESLQEWSGSWRRGWRAGSGSSRAPEPPGRARAGRPAQPRRGASSLTQRVAFHDALCYK